MSNQPSPSSIIIMVSGAVILLGSFLDFIEDETAWAKTLFPLTTLPAILGVIMAVVVAITTFGNAKLPERVLGLGWNQIHLALGIHAGLMMIGFLIGSFSIDELGSDPDKAIGFWLMLLAGIGLAVGAVMRDREAATT